jgi:hypothetical protein
MTTEEIDFEKLEPVRNRPALHKTPRTGRHAILPGVGLPPPNFIVPLDLEISIDGESPDIDVPGRLPEDAPNRIVRSESVPDDTETLLNALVGECHFLMREVAFRCIIQTTDADQRLRFLHSAMSLAETGAKVAETVGHLRGGLPVNEKRQRMIFEHIHTRTGEGV